MKVPIEWLKEFVNFRAGPDQLAEMLTMAGLETIVLPENILEVDVLPNRADCLSIRGIAREVSALTKLRMQKVKFKIKELSKDKINNVLRVEVRDQKLCPRYMAAVIQKVKVGNSPEWLKKKLERAGFRSINNVVDVTNYLLHEIGQPMHAFDASLVKDQTIIVRRANPGEKIVTLDGREHQLESDMLVIADVEKAIAIAGVMGAANTEVSQTTKTVVLESAFFDPVSIHKTSKLLKLRTESSIRFEHGVDWQAVSETLDRAAALIAELTQGEIARGKIDIKTKALKPKVVELRMERLSKILGVEILPAEAASILRRLSFVIRKVSREKVVVEIPLFRAMDIEREIDLIEEIARVYGYHRLPSTMPNTAFLGKEIARGDILRNKLQQILIGCGLSEVHTNSLLGPKDFEKVGLSPEKAVRITNPLSLEESIMRTHLLPGLLKVLTHNQNHQIDNVFIFEIGKVFNSSSGELPDEKWKCGGVLMGSPFMSALDKGEVDYFYVKGVVESIFLGLGLELPRLSETENFLLQPGKAATIENLGYFGALHPDIRRNFEISKPVFYFEFDLDALFKLIPLEKKYQPLPKFPFVYRDVSMYLPQGLENQRIVEFISKVGGHLVEKVYPFDKYKDSIAYRIIYRSPEKTLTEEEVNKKHQEIIQKLVEEFRVQIR
ncbi:MAG: phenylalanine--tRNA ligase subunit beta [Candidatus Margulisiibacteriota bacterium]